MASLRVGVPLLRILIDLIIWGWSLLDKVRSEDETDFEPFFSFKQRSLTHLFFARQATE